MVGVWLIRKEQLERQPNLSRKRCPATDFLRKFNLSCSQHQLYWFQLEP